MSSTHCNWYYLSAGVFPFYIIHQTTIVAVGHALTPFALSWPAESGLIIAATLAACLATYALARRVRVPGPLLGVRRLPISIKGIFTSRTA